MEKRREPFRFSRRAAIIAASLAFAVIVLVAAIVFSTSAIARKSAIGEEKAENFAFADLGMDPLSAEGVRTEFGFEQGQFVYKVYFTADGTEYEYWIKASDGAIVKKEMDIAAHGEAQTAKETKTQQAAETGAQQAPKETKEKNADSIAPEEPQGDGTEIGLDAAKEIVISDAGVSEADVTYTKTELEYEEGVQVYEIEFYSSTDEYKYEINAVTGVIRSKDKEAFHTNIEDNHHGNTGADIGVEQAKSIAVSHADFSVSEVSFSKAKLEKEDGNLVYEIKFYKDGMEYEYEILAATGEIIKFDSEWDD